MTTRSATIFFLFVILLMLSMPYLGGLIRWDGGLPPGFGIFPERHYTGPETQFNLPYFLVVAAIGAVTLAFLIFPRWFGVKGGVGRRSSDPGAASGGRNFPTWFWLGVVLNLAAWVAMWGQFSWLGPAVHYTFVPLWWGFILVLDGLVYWRTGGRSILATRPRSLAALALTSALFWLLFEYYDYFVLENWYYPNDKIFSPLGYRIWFTLCYTSVWPAMFEFYSLLTTFGGLRSRYLRGPKWTLSKRAAGILFTLGVLISFGVGVFPHLLFVGVWIGPLILTIGALGLAGYWSPVSSLADGNWSYLALFGMAGFFNGIFWETWNGPSSPLNPSFWRYEVPFVNVGIQIFEMPIMGFIGYIPFGVMCAASWLFFARLMHWDASAGGRLPEPGDTSEAQASTATAREADAAGLPA